jgi:peptidoglycan hydrolase CwlO-like protein
MNDNNRDMFYSGFYGMSPVPNMPNQMVNPSMMTSQMPNPNLTNATTPYNNYNYENNYYNNNYANLDNKITRLENQIKSINQRLARLEAPYNSSSNTYNNEPDSNMYIM